MSKGKYAEKKVRDYLKKVATARADICMDRIDDARSSLGRNTKRRPADFAVYLPGHHVWIEVKEVAHDFRLPKKNVTQLPALRLRALAGGTPVILVFHSTTRKWRIPDFDWMVENDEKSYDLRKFPEYGSVDECLNFLVTM